MRSSRAGAAGLPGCLAWLARFCAAGFRRRRSRRFRRLSADHLARGRFGGFLARFLGHTPSFRRFRRINQGGIAGRVPARRNRPGCWPSLMAPEYGYKEFDAPPVRSLTALLGRMTNNSINRGLAAMPAQERSLRAERGRGGDQSYDQRQHREAMARNSSPQGSNPRADVESSQWDDADWD